MILRQPDVLVHVERHHVLESAKVLSVHDRTAREAKDAYETLPAFTSLMSALYVGMGDDPVGRPSTNGFSGVGSKSLILQCERRDSRESGSRAPRMDRKQNGPIADVVCDVVAHLGWVVADDKTWRSVNP